MPVLVAVSDNTYGFCFRAVQEARPLERSGKGRVRFNVKFLISHPPEGEHPAAIAARLADMGGFLTGWHPAVDGAPARAYFSFASEDERERFRAGALNLPGVSIAEP